MYENPVQTVQKVPFVVRTLPWVTPSNTPQTGIIPSLWAYRPGLVKWEKYDLKFTVRLKWVFDLSVKVTRLLGV